MFTPDEALEAIERAERERQERERRYLSDDDVADMAEQVGVPGDSARRHLPPHGSSNQEPPRQGFRFVRPGLLTLLHWAFWAYLLWSVATIGLATALG